MSDDGPSEPEKDDKKDAAPGSDGDAPATPTPPAEHTERKPAAWGRPLARLDAVWTRFEMRLCAVVLLLEILALTMWVALKGMSSPPDAGNAGVVFRALTGAWLVGSVGWFATKKQSEGVRRIAAVGGVLLGLFTAKVWAKLGVDYSSNLLNWYQQASTLTLVGGLRGVGTRLTLLLALLGGSLATAAGRHITIDVVTRFLKPKVRLPVTVFGWFGSAAICMVAAWGFLDHIAIENFGAKPEASAGEKLSKVKQEFGEDLFILRKQLALDLKSTPHVVFKGETYSEWLGGKEWNAWLVDSGFEERFGKQAMEAIKLADDEKRSPIVVVPGEGEPRGKLSHTANLVAPIGLFIIALRFILRALLALSGHVGVDAEEAEEIGKKRSDDGEAEGQA